MKKCLCAVLIFMALVFIAPSLVSTPVCAAEIESEYCIAATPAITQAAYEYLDEIYIDKYPELALEYSFGSDKDKNTLKARADRIVKGLTTDKDKAYAIVNWVQENIEYVSYFSGEAEYFAIDTYYAKKGNCLGISQMIVQFCRLNGIKAVMCCGTRGDMKGYIKLDSRDMDHAWAMIYYNDNWHLFDPLFSVYGTADKSYIARWYFTDFIEGVSPYVEGYAKYTNYGDAIFYIDGKFMHYKEGIPASDYWEMGAGGGTAVNGALPYFTLNRYDNKHGTGMGGYEYVENPSRKDTMINDECFFDGWVSYGEALYYAKPNGIRAGSTFKTDNGICYYLPFHSSAVIMSGKSTDYTFTDGFPTVMKGSTLTVQPSWAESELERGKVIVWETLTPEIAKVTQDGKITALSDGIATLHVCSKDTVDDDSHYMAGFVELYVSSEERTVSYTSDFDFKLSATSYTYDGKAKTPSVTVKDSNGKTLVKGTDYTVTYPSGRTAPGTYDVVITLQGNYSGTKTLSFTIGLEAPAVKAANAVNGVKVSWNKISGATSYKVYRSVYSGGKWSGWTAIKTGVTGTSYTDTTVKSADNVKYTVRAFNGSHSSTYKASNSIKFLATPTVKATNAANGVKISWNKITGAKSYTVYRSVYSNGAWSGWKAIKTGVTGTSFTDTTVKSGATVKYTVRAVNGNYASAYKASNGTKFLAQPKVTVAKVTNGIKATWGKITGATGYIVYRRAYVNGKWGAWEKVKTTTAVSFTDTTAKKGVTYQYTVRAYSGSYKSTYTNSTSIKR